MIRLYHATCGNSSHVNHLLTLGGAIIVRIWICPDKRTQVIGSSRLIFGSVRLVPIVSTVPVIVVLFKIQADFNDREY